MDQSQNEEEAPPEGRSADAARPLDETEAELEATESHMPEAPIDDGEHPPSSA